MSRRPKYAKQRDGNEAGIVKALRARDASVTLLDGEPGLPDLLVGYRGHTWLVEVKLPAGPRGGTKRSHAYLKPDQVSWHANWRGEKPVVVRTIAEAIAVIDAPQPLTIDEVKSALVAGSKERVAAEMRARGQRLGRRA